MRIPGCAGDQQPVDDEPIVAARQRPLNGAGLLGAKPVGVLLVRVDQDLQLLDAVGARGRGTHVWTRLLAGARRLPEHRVAAPRGGDTSWERFSRDRCRITSM